jgi:hypothetical protein
MAGSERAVGMRRIHSSEVSDRAHQRSSSTNDLKRLMTASHCSEI